MGQKVNPTIFRIGPLHSWTSRWYAAPKDYARTLREDIEIRKFLKKRLKSASVDRVIIERSRGTVTITIHTAKPGMIIGRGGQGIEDLRSEIATKIIKRNEWNKKNSVKEKLVLHINIQEVSKPNLSSAIVKEQIISEIEKRLPYRKIMKQTIDRVMKAGALGVKIGIKGRLNGAEIARGETLGEGKIPLHTLRADIDYSRGTANTLFGAIGVKVWINRGEIFNKEEHASAKKS